MAPLTPRESAADAAKDSTELFEYAPPPYFDASSRVPKWLQPWIADTFAFTMIHYNLWFIPFVALFYYLYQVRALRVAMCGKKASRRAYRCL